MVPTSSLGSSATKRMPSFFITALEAFSPASEWAITALARGEATEPAAG